MSVPCARSFLRILSQQNFFEKTLIDPLLGGGGVDGQDGILEGL